MHNTMSEEVRQLEGISEDMKIKGAQLQELRQTTERDIRQRADALIQKVIECRDASLATLQSFNAEVEAYFSNIWTRVYDQGVTLTAQSQEVARTLQENNAADIVALEDQLKDFSVDRQEVERLLSQAESLSKPYVCDSNATTINPAMFNAIQEYIGVLKPGHTQAQHLQSIGFAAGARPGLSSSLSVLGVAAKPSKNIYQLDYSQNSSSDVVCMCVTTEKRVWILFRPNGVVTVAGLFGQNGLIEKVTGVDDYEAMISCADGTTLCFKRHWPNAEIFSLRPGQQGVAALQWAGTDNSIPKYSLQVAKGIARSGFFASSFLSGASSLVKIEVKSVNPVTLSMSKVGAGAAQVYDVSCSESYFAVGLEASKRNEHRNFGVFARSGSGTPKFQSLYFPQCNKNTTQYLDACFLTVHGQERLIVLVKGENRLHVVDHTDGCTFLGYLDTGSVKLEKPRCLAIDHVSVLWIACDGGKVIMMTVE
jgi:hypothetical protein